MTDFDKIANAYIENTYLRGKSLDIASMARLVQNKDETGEDGENLQHIAARYADCETIQILANNGLSIITDNKGNTPLHSLAQSYEAKLFDLKHEDIYKTASLLLKLGINPQQKNHQQQTAYMIAAERAVYPFIESMIDEHVKMDIRDNDGSSILHILCKNLKQKKNIQGFTESAYKTAQLIIEANYINPKITDQLGKTPLYYAQSADDENMITLLCGNDNQTKLSYKLDKLVISKDIRSIETLLNEGADVNAVSDLFAKTALMLACEYPSVRIVELLIKHGADINFKAQETGHTAIYYLLKAGAFNLNKENKSQYLSTLKKILSLLIENGLNLDAPIDSENNTVLNCICSSDYIPGIQNQLAKEIINIGCDINLPNKEGKTPLMSFAETGSEQEDGIAGLLIENNADCTHIDIHKYTALMYAAQNKNMQSGKKIVEHILYADKYTINNKNEQKQTAMDIAIKTGNEGIIKLLKENLGE